jgi:DNA-binding transcriptional LysR family regulator
MFDDLFLFVKLVEAGSFSGLAKILKMTQATVSRRIQALEAELGVSLIRRDTRNFEVTEIGQQLYQMFLSKEADLKNGLDSVLLSHKDISGTLRVSLPAVLSKNIISPYLVDFIRQYPKINLHVKYSSTPVDLIKEGFNLVVSGTMAGSQNNLVRLLYKLQLQLFASPKYMEQYGSINSLDELSAHLDLLGMLSPEDVAISNYLAVNLISGEETIIKANPRMYINNSLHAIDMALHGNIIIGGWDALIQDELRSGRLVKILPEYSFGELPCYLVRRSGALSVLEQKFIQFLDECIVLLT